MNRLKDDSPLKTVERVRAILRDLDIFTVEHWSESCIPGIYSVRVVVIRTNIGTNGKGATESLALASGYGEFLERLQNGLLFSSFRSVQKSTHFGCCDVPVARYMKPSPLFDGVLFGMKSPEENAKDGISDYIELGKRIDAKRSRIDLWGSLKSLMAKESSQVSAVSFVDLESHEKEYLPVSMLCAYGSHGMAAGNSCKEAVVQGVSEIFERYCQKRVLDLKLNPPEIPFEILEKKFSGIAKYKLFIENCSEMSVQLRDCSLGQGFPVFCICITNRKTHCFSVTFGAHPNVEVALERLFTEVFQGRTLMDVSNKIDAKVLPEPYNTKSLFKVSMGHYPVEFWRSEPSYDYDEALLSQSFESNAEAFAYCRSFCRSKGMRIYARDASYLGFPSVHIVVPGFSEVLCCNDLTLRHNDTSKKVTEYMLRYDTLNDVEKQLILEFVDFCRKVGITGTSRPYNYLKYPLRDLSVSGKVLVFLALVSLDLKKPERARHFFEKLIEDPTVDDDLDTFRCLANLSGLFCDGIGVSESLATLSRFYDKKNIESARQVLGFRPVDMVDVSEQESIEEKLRPSVEMLWNKSQAFQSKLLEHCQC